MIDKSIRQHYHNKYSAKNRKGLDEGGWGGDESWNEPDSHDFSEDIGSVGDTEPSHDFSTDIGTVGDTGYIPPPPEGNTGINPTVKKVGGNLINYGGTKLLGNTLGIGTIPARAAWNFGVKPIGKAIYNKITGKQEGVGGTTIANLTPVQEAMVDDMLKQGADESTIITVTGATKEEIDARRNMPKKAQGGIINGRAKFDEGMYYEAPADPMGSGMPETSEEMTAIDDTRDDLNRDYQSYVGGEGMQTWEEFSTGRPNTTPSHGGNIKNPLHPGYNPNDIYNHGITRLPNRGGIGPTPLINAQTIEVNTHLRQYYRNMYPNKTEEEIDELMEGNTQSAAEGGRMGYALGTNGNGWHQGDWTDPNDPDYEPKPQKLAENTDALQSLLKEFIETHKRYPKDMEELKRWALKRMQGGTTEEESTSLAEILPEKQDGGRIGYALGPRDPGLQSAVGDIPTRQNEAGVTELDFRDNGGFVPPIGIKEKADDIPAMVSNNEFVFTADAVKAAGGGNVDKGAQRMYDLMKQLEGKIA